MTITSQEIPRERWRPYFEELTDGLGTVEGTVEVIGRDIGDQIADERQVVTYIAYDDRDDVLIVALEAPDSDVGRVEHMIEHPSESWWPQASRRRWK